GLKEMSEQDSPRSLSLFYNSRSLKKIELFDFDRQSNLRSSTGGRGLLAELLEAMKFGDLLLRFAQRNRIGKGFGHGLTSHPSSEAKLGIVARVVRLSAMAGWLAASSHNGGNGTRPQVAKAQELLQKLGACVFQSREIVRHWGFFLYVYIRPELWHK